MRIWEANLLLFGTLPAAIGIYFLSQRQRIGDRMVGTFVVLSRALHRQSTDGSVW